MSQLKSVPLKMCNRAKESHATFVHTEYQKWWLKMIIILCDDKNYQQSRTDLFLQ